MSYSIATIIYSIIIVILICINIAQYKQRKKIKNKNLNVKLSQDFTGNNLKQLQDNYKILSKMLDNISSKVDDPNEKIDKN